MTLTGSRGGKFKNFCSKFGQEKSWTKEHLYTRDDQEGEEGELNCRSFNSCESNGLPNQCKEGLNNLNINQINSQNAPWISLIIRSDSSLDNSTPHMVCD